MRRLIWIADRHEYRLRRRWAVENTREQTTELFVHKVDKSQIPVCNIMGVDIAAINMKWLLDFTYMNIGRLSGDYCCVSNVHTTVLSYKNQEYCAIQNGGALAIPDGGPLSSVGRSRGYRGMERTAGPDYMREVLKASMKKGYRHYFYGSTDETLEKMRRNLEVEYPTLQIAGMYSPPFRDLEADEDMDIINRINASDADFVWIGLGAPRQELWMAGHQGKIRGFMVGVGAGFDYLAGNISRAPEWMQRRNLEWVYRLIQEPGRLFKRYIETNVSFIWHAVLHGR